MHVGQVLNLFGFYPSKSELVEFKLLDFRRKQHPVDHNALSAKLAKNKKEWNSLTEVEGETRSARRSDASLNGLWWNHKSKGNVPDPKDETPDKPENNKVTPAKKKRKSGGGGFSYACAKCALRKEKGSDGPIFCRLPPP